MTTDPMQEYPELVAKLVGAICGGHSKVERERYATLYMKEHENAARYREGREGHE